MRFPVAHVLLTPLFVVVTSVSFSATAGKLAEAPVRPTDNDGCSFTASEQRFVDLLLNSPRQKRSELHCSPQLQAFARHRALDMAKRNYFGHVDPDGIGPNAALKRFGYPLPGTYVGGIANNVESIAAGYASAPGVWHDFLHSNQHREHLLGDANSYREQNEFGVAHVHIQGSEYGDYWVVEIARRKRPGESDYICTPQPETTCYPVHRTGRKKSGSGKGSAENQKAGVGN
ncbi:MAG: hypothetical protein PVI56_09910 [Gammaproteobacteria bacterium]|jgi:uncharacterized protein YkwD